MWVDETVLGPIRARYGAPAQLGLELEISSEERDLVLASGRTGRRHDVTFFVMNAGRIALIRKPHYEAGLWRPPGGGLRRGEGFETGVRREALEELGVEIELVRYLVDVHAVFTCDDAEIPWRTHVLEAASASAALGPLDENEIAAARWGTLAELAGPIRERLLGTGRALWGYRVALHDAALAELG